MYGPGSFGPFVFSFIHDINSGSMHPTFRRVVFTNAPNGARFLTHIEVTHHQAIFNRSIFAMVDIYNNLPQYVVDSPTISTFQSLLTRIARRRCESGDVSWASSFCRTFEHHFED